MSDRKKSNANADALASDEAGWSLPLAVEVILEIEKEAEGGFGNRPLLL